MSEKPDNNPQRGRNSNLNFEIDIDANLDNSVTNTDNSTSSNTTNTDNSVTNTDNSTSSNTTNTDNSTTNNTTNNDNSVTNNSDIDNITHISNNYYTVYKVNKITNYFYGSKDKDVFKGTNYVDKIFGNGGKDIYKLSSDSIVDHIYIKRDGVADIARKLSNEDRIHLDGEITLKTTAKGIKVFSDGVVELFYKGNTLTENILETIIV